VTVGVSLDSENCQAEGCAQEGRQRKNAGKVLCDEHYSAEMRRRGSLAAGVGGSAARNGGLVAQVKALEALARRLERARAKAEPALRELKVAQRDFEAALAALAEKRPRE
jgi:hypothetical protein